MADFYASLPPALSQVSVPSVNATVPFAERGLSSPEERSGVSVNTYINMLQAATEGQGVALAGHSLVDRFLAGRSLKTVAEIPALQRDFYNLYRRPEHEHAQIFGAWIEEQFD